MKKERAMLKTRPLLLIEDDKVDAMTVKRAMEEIGVIESFVHLSNGEEALDYLQSEVNEKPCLILLDLNMPRMNGIEFLEKARVDPAIRNIPVVVLTTSREDREIVKTFKESVAGYMVKPVDYDQFVEQMRVISECWALSRPSEAL